MHYYNSMRFHPLTLSAYLCIQIAPLTCFSAETTQIAGCDLVKRENAHKQGNVTQAVKAQEQAVTGGRMRSQQTSLLSERQSQDGNNCSESYVTVLMPFTVLSTPPAIIFSSWNIHV